MILLLSAKEASVDQVKVPSNCLAGLCVLVIGSSCSQPDLGDSVEGRSGIPSPTSIEASDVSALADCLKSARWDVIYDPRDESVSYSVDESQQAGFDSDCSQCESDIG